jgi:small subunit ribosomal protein S18
MLAQFVSNHTGLVYDKHITGLCEFMQEEVTLEVRRAQKMGMYYVLSSTTRLKKLNLIP